MRDRAWVRRPEDKITIIDLIYEEFSTTRMSYTISKLPPLWIPNVNDLDTFGSDLVSPQT